jgi:uncharacterized damage-inducible protein DinB
MGTKILLAVSAAGWLGAAGKGDITGAEREKAAAYLAATRAGVLDAVKGLSEAQLRFKAGPEKWSAAETLEHLALTEDLFVREVRPQLERPPAGLPNSRAQEVDAMILARVPDRSHKVQAPPALTPSGRWTPEEALERFSESRAQTLEFLKDNTELRLHTVNHPGLGPLDGYEWVLAVAAHSERHTRQILEIKADPGFPKK